MVTTLDQYIPADEGPLPVPRLILGTGPDDVLLGEPVRDAGTESLPLALASLIAADYDDDGLDPIVAEADRAEAPARVEQVAGELVERAERAGLMPARWEFWGSPDAIDLLFVDLEAKPLADSSLNITDMRSSESLPDDVLYIVPMSIVNGRATIYRRNGRIALTTPYLAGRIALT